LNTTNTYSSWGTAIQSGTPIYDNIGEFFQKGIIYDNNVNVSGGSKNGSFIYQDLTSTKQVSFPVQLMIKQPSGLMANRDTAV